MKPLKKSISLTLDEDIIEKMPYKNIQEYLEDFDYLVHLIHLVALRMDYVRRLLFLLLHLIHRMENHL